MRVTEWDEELCSYVLKEKFKGDKLTERDLINLLGDLEDFEEKVIAFRDIVLDYHSVRQMHLHQLAKKDNQNGIN